MSDSHVRDLCRAPPWTRWIWLRIRDLLSLSFDRERIERAANMMSWSGSVVVGIAALTSGTTSIASTHANQGRPTNSQRDVAAVSSKTSRPDIERAAEKSPLGIAGIRLDHAPPEEANAAVLKFHMSNVGSTGLTDIVFEVSIVEEPRHEHVDTTRRVLAGPFVIRGKFVLDPGNTADCEILLRNMSPACRCAAKVRILSFRSTEESGL